MSGERRKGKHDRSAQVEAREVRKVDAVELETSEERAFGDGPLPEPHP
jgi:hypothetical protein